MGVLMAVAGVGAMGELCRSAGCFMGFRVSRPASLGREKPCGPRQRFVHVSGFQYSKPPRCSLASRYGPSAMSTSPLGWPRSDFASLGAPRPHASSVAPAAINSSMRSLIAWIVASSIVEGSKSSGVVTNKILWLDFSFSVYRSWGRTGRAGHHYHDEWPDRNSTTQTQDFVSSTV